MVPRSSTLAWKIPWIEEPGGLQSMGSLRVGHDASLCLMQDTACLELVHGDDPERCYGEGGGRGVHVWERM